MNKLIKEMSLSRLAIVFLSIFLFWGCLGRKQEQEGPKYDMFQNFSTKFNIVYHGRLILDDVERQITEGHRENFQQLIPVFIEPPGMQETPYAHLADSVLGKARDIINRKTKSKYINEAYFLSGRANYMKGNFYNAAEFFTYTANTFADMPEYRQPALTMKARALMNLQNYAQAGKILDTALNGLEADGKSKALVYAAKAKHDIQSGRLEAAVTMLELAIEHEKRTQIKLRWHFLIAQLSEKLGRGEAAYYHYSRIMSSNASYEMAFHAELNRIFLVTANQASIDERIRLLKAMLRDIKNKDFKDQIYHQIGVQYEEAGQYGEALKHYNLALRQQPASRFQHTVTYLKIADHYFGQREYLDSKLYYDSVGMVVPSDFPDIRVIQRKIANMDELIVLLETVSFQDSLLHLNRLDESVRMLAIDSIIEKRYARMQEIKKAEEAAAKQASRSPGRRTTVFDTDPVAAARVTHTDGRFYFNNQDAMGMGIAEFRRRWGNRALQDNWKFSELLVAAGTVSAPETNRDDQAVDQKSRKEETAFDSLAWAADIRTYYLDIIPKTTDQILASETVVRTNLIKIGDLYRDGLRDFAGAANTFERFLGRFPGSEDEPMILYNLYRMYTELNDEPQANHYKDRLLRQYPETLYANILRDPMYLAKLNQEKEALNREYEKIYMLYIDEAYDRVKENVDYVMAQRYENTAKLAQFAYLRSLAVGRTAGVGSFEVSLNQLVQTYPEDSLVTPLAKLHLDYIAQNRDTLAYRDEVLYAFDDGRERFVDEPTMTLWPALHIDRNWRMPRGKEVVVAAVPEEELVEELTAEEVEEAVEAVAEQLEETEVEIDSPVTEEVEEVAEKERKQVLEMAARTAQAAGAQAGQIQGISTTRVDRPAVIELDEDENLFRDKVLLPDEATYFFVINVMNDKVNLAPSRFGIGQFNRTRYSGASIAHQLKMVNNENQLVFIGPFRTYEDAKLYETRILPLLPDIMKIPTDLYNTFLITEENFGTLSDSDEIGDYHAVYEEQP